MLKAEPLRTLPFGHGSQTESKLPRDCDVLEMNSVAGGGSSAPLCDRQICAEGFLGEIFQSYWIAPHSNLNSCAPTQPPFVFFAFSLLLLKQSCVSVWATVPDWELVFTVSMVPKLDKPDESCIHSGCRTREEKSENSVVLYISSI